MCTEDMELEDWMIFKYSDKEPREFRKQAEAIEAAATKNGLKVFSKEINQNGAEYFSFVSPILFGRGTYTRTPKTITKYWSTKRISNLSLIHI